jgi:hypothetical protein
VHDVAAIVEVDSQNRQVSSLEDLHPKYDMSNFGKISKAILTAIGPSTAFAGRKNIRRGTQLRTSSSSNMFTNLNM